MQPRNLAPKSPKTSPFGMLMLERGSGTPEYRYAYNGMELDNEPKGNGNSYTTEFRQYDPRLGRWLSLDPLMAQFPWMSPYVAFDNNPVYYVDPYGLEAEGWIKQAKKDKDGNVIEGKYTWTFDKEIKSLEQAQNTKEYSDAVDYTDGGLEITQRGEFGWGTNVLNENGTSRGFEYDNPTMATLPTSQIGGTTEFTLSKQQELLTSPITNAGAGVILMNESGFQDQWGDSDDWQRFNAYMAEFALQVALFAGGEAFFSVLPGSGIGTKSSKTVLKSSETTIKITEIVTENGIKITGFRGHAVHRAIERGVSPSSILNAIKEPLKIGKVIIDDLGRPSQRLIGKNAEVVVNPSNGRIISVNPTSTRKAAKLLRNQ